MLGSMMPQWLQRATLYLANNSRRKKEALARKQFARRQGWSVSYECIVHMRNMVHTLRNVYGSGRLPQFDPVANHLCMADLIGRALFESVTGNHEFLESAEIFDSRYLGVDHHSDFLRREFLAGLASMDVGAFNERRDELIAAPNRDDALRLMTRLVEHMFESQPGTRNAAQVPMP